MTTEELMEFKQSLEEEKVMILSELEKFTIKNPLIKGDFQTTREPTDPSDSSDVRSSNIEEFERKRAAEQKLESRLADIEKALEQIKAGSYGTCSTCKSPINTKRLKVMLTAQRCINCAQRITLK